MTDKSITEIVTYFCGSMCGFDDELPVAPKQVDPDAQVVSADANQTKKEQQ